MVIFRGRVATEGHPYSLAIQAHSTKGRGSNTVGAALRGRPSPRLALWFN